MVRKFVSTIILVCFTTLSVVPPSYAQSIASLSLPTPGVMVMPTEAFVPVLLKGMTIHPDDALKFDFIVDSGDTEFSSDEVRKEAERLVKYFLASMTVPKNDLWVNLSPYEKDRIIPEELGKTALGRDLLAQDYILKQLTASMMYPEDELGKKFWERIRKKAEEKYGVTDIPTNTFNKVWILPESASVYEHEQTVYIVNAKLKVMLDTDYLALQVEAGDGEEGATSRAKQASDEIIREIIIPEIEKEVNNGKNFAPLRQIYHSLILAKWYKQNIKNSLLSQVYTDQNKTKGIEIDDDSIKNEIYERYMKAYEKGVFSYIKEDYDALSQTVIPRKYFSGGIGDSASLVIRKMDSAVVATQFSRNDREKMKYGNLGVRIGPVGVKGKDLLGAKEDSAVLTQAGDEARKRAEEAILIASITTVDICLCLFK